MGLISCPDCGRWVRVAALALLAAASSGCGLVFQGFHQDVSVIVDGGPAVVTLSGEQATSPATFTVRRRSTWRVARAEAPGKAPACQLVQCRMRPALKALDMVALFIPFAVDASLKTLGHCPNTVHLKLEDMPEDVPMYSLQGDRRILEAFRQSRRTINMCESPHLYATEFGEQAKRIVVTAGSLQRAYDILGSVDMMFPGMDRAATVVWGLGRVAVGNTRREFYQAPTALVNDALRREALMQFGRKVDAIINVNYMTNPRHDVSATGVAIRFNRHEKD